MTMQLSTAAKPLNAAEASANREGLGGAVRCLFCSLVRGQFRSVDHYCLRSTWELEALNDSTLRDIGIHRSVIEAHTIARN